MTNDRELQDFLAGLATPIVFLELYDLVPETVFFLKDRQGRYLAVNTTLVERCGLRRKSDLLGRTVEEVFPAPLALTYLEQDRQVLKSGTAIVGKLELHLYPNRQPGWCLTTKVPLRDRSGRIVGLAGLSRDLPGAGTAAAIPRALAATIEFMTAHYAEPLTVSLLARRAGLSVNAFGRRVKRLFLLTPSQLLLQTRLQAATHRLRETDLSMAAIALECGFYDQSAFSKQFKAATAVNPLSYRIMARTE